MLSRVFASDVSCGCAKKWPLIEKRPLAQKRPLALKRPLAQKRPLIKKLSAEKQKCLDTILMKQDSFNTPICCDDMSPREDTPKNSLSVLFGEKSSEPKPLRKATVEKTPSPVKRPLKEAVCAEITAKPAIAKAIAPHGIFGRERNWICLRVQRSTC